MFEPNVYDVIIGHVAGCAIHADLRRLDDYRDRSVLVPGTLIPVRLDHKSRSSGRRRTAMYRLISLENEHLSSSSLRAPIDGYSAPIAACAERSPPATRTARIVCVVADQHSEAHADGLEARAGAGSATVATYASYGAFKAIPSGLTAW